MVKASTRRERGRGFVGENRTKRMTPRGGFFVKYQQNREQQGKENTGVRLKKKTGGLQETQLNHLWSSKEEEGALERGREVGCRLFDQKPPFVERCAGGRSCSPETPRSKGNVLRTDQTTIHESRFLKQKNVGKKERFPRVAFWV